MKKEIKVIIKGKKCPVKGLFGSRSHNFSKSYYSDVVRGIYIGCVCQKCGMTIVVDTLKVGK